MTDLYGNKYINDNNTTQEGFPISSWYGYVADGYFQSKEEINSYPVYGNNKDNVKPGYIKYKDISGPEGYLMARSQMRIVRLSVIHNHVILLV